MTSIRSTWQHERRRELAFEPTVRQPLGRTRLRAAYVAAIVAPLAVGAVMIPLLSLAFFLANGDVVWRRMHRG